MLFTIILNQLTYATIVAEKFTLCRCLNGHLIGFHGSVKIICDAMIVKNLLLKFVVDCRVVDSVCGNEYCSGKVQIAPGIVLLVRSDMLTNR